MLKKKKNIILIVAIAIILTTTLVLVSYILNMTVDIEQYKNKSQSVEATPFLEVPTSASIEGMKMVAESDACVMGINPKTSVVAIMDKNSKKIFYTNPPECNKDEAASLAVKELLASQFTLSIINDKNQTTKMNNYKYSIENEQFELQSIENGVRVKYIVGDLSKNVNSIPLYITPDRLEEKILSELSEKDAKAVRRKYIESDVKEGFLERMQSLSQNKIQIKKTLELIYDVAGYTEEDLNEDNALAGIGETSGNTYVEIYVDYILKNDEFIVDIPMDKIVINGDAELVGIEVLPYFDAAGLEDEGYMVVPSGSGALINLNNGKTYESDYAQAVYGCDLAVKQKKKEDSEIVSLPVYGIKTQKKAHLAYITSGEAFATVNAKVSGKTSSYNNVYSSFELKSSEEINMSTGDGEEVYMEMFEEGTYAGNITINYILLPKDDVSYSDMAKSYREKLFCDGVLSPLEQSDIPLYLKVLGSVEKKKHIMGIPYSGNVIMTDIDDINGMLNIFDSQNINNIHIKLDGWFNGGVNHESIKSISLENIGSKGDLKTLQSRLQETGGGIYPNVNIGTVSYETPLFIEFVEASRNIRGRVALITPYNRATELSEFKTRDGYKYVLNPATIPKNIESFLKKYDKYDINSLSIGDVGSLLASNKDKKDFVLRETSKNITAEILSNISSQIDNVMIETGNIYALPYADHIVNIPIGSNKNHLIDKDIPFYQIVAHGYVNYGSSPLNLYDAYNYEQMLLNLIEYGASPLFTVTSLPTSNLKNTAYQDNYSTEFDIWCDDIISMYNEVNSVLSYLSAETIEEHEYLDNDLVKVTYSNSQVIYINYSDKNKRADGLTIPAKDYLLGGIE